VETPPSRPQRSSTPATPPVMKNEKKALKKAKAKERKVGNDELDQAIAELSSKYVSPSIYISPTHLSYP
jgi:hypothetical protein